MTRPADLPAFLEGCPPFDALGAAELAQTAAEARIVRYAAGESIIDAFIEPTDEIFVVISGEVDLWNDPNRINDGPDDHLGPRDLFGFSAMLTNRAVGPRAAAGTAVTLARIPASVAAQAFSSGTGARFLAEHVSYAHRRDSTPPTYSMVKDLVASRPLVVEPATPADAVARLMTEHGSACVVVEIEAGRYGMITDAVLRRRLLAEGLPPDTPAGVVMDYPAASTPYQASAAEALIQLLDRDAEFLLVTDRVGTLRGVVNSRDFVVSPTTAGVGLHEQIRRAASVDELIERTRRVPAMLTDVLHRGLASGRVISVYSAIVDTIVRRSIGLVFGRHPELSVDAFTWLSLGSNGRREATLSSDVDAAVAFDDSLSETEMSRYRAVFAEVNAVLGRAGISVDSNGANAARPPFARTNSQWRAAAAQWLASPQEDKGVIMTSLLVDGRPIHGDPGLPEVAKVFADLRRHPGTMQLLLQESLSRRARLRSVRDILKGRGDTFDMKAHALLPVVNIARWAALGAGSADLHTTDRLRSGSGSAILPDGYAGRLIEAFEALQRLRLRYQLAQVQRAEVPSHIVERDTLSPIDRSTLAQAVREIAAAQRRMDSIASYVPAQQWVTTAAAARPRNTS